ncbi:maleylacetoacetate isomerase [Pseudoalteromonas flavipulchra]|uniref:Maleylacetoacetate isomerase n=1 Tax=Pseudoalteromonas maricaloris TaxID=184924 RepID=A0A8I2KRU9_9GAMM|nr:maleylacetoacetate isomerase [Pseudoalteromonas flavipulchra NCIMB 2033 = ATCC BAA-314]MBD0780566.1 maleylacetoacetate isomerase [Pseudoalteromonas flavipulchra]MBE0375356.1 maleylpyruvate isomerase [Pseudoalteromonas flavipulchra NCIMB 2033 = ATCC BAA-314]NLR23047.1 maleylacetoacetate isomerase [Pseudoalteromonas maricaloris]RZG12529.1 maleylacetoacetate isomerase [Pseudoalteromonas sp. CO342X]
MLKLYTYFRSSAAYRVRIALNLKGLDHELVPVNLLKSEQSGEAYLSKNGQGLLPALETEHGVLAQSLAILEWLEETQTGQALLPQDPWQKAQVRNFCYAIACDIHPIDNLRVLKYLSSQLGASDEQKNEWYRHWVIEGFKKLEPMIGDGQFCFGTEPTLADVCLVPQVFNALRFKVDMTEFPKISRVYEYCNMLSAFSDAAPENQLDAQ